MNYLPLYLENVKNYCNLNNVDLYITDDNSKDGSVSYLIENNYIYTVNKNINNGFAANVNNGINFAISKKNYDYFIISNNDIEFHKDFFKYFINTLKTISNQFNKIGIIGFDEINTIDKTYFDYFDYTNYISSKYELVKEIPGFFFVISSNLLNEIGYLDEEYFMYGEDNDYFIRAYKANFKIIKLPIPILHYSEGSSSNHKKTSWYVYRNAFLLTQKNGTFIDFITVFFKFIFFIYNPFVKNESPSVLRIKRNGFFYNNYLLFKSLFWNLKYFYFKNFTNIKNN